MLCARVMERVLLRGRARVRVRAHRSARVSGRVRVRVLYVSCVCTCTCTVRARGGADMCGFMCMCLGPLGSALVGGVACTLAHFGGLHYLALALATSSADRLNACAFRPAVFTFLREVFHISCLSDLSTGGPNPCSFRAAVFTFLRAVFSFSTRCCGSCGGVPFHKAVPLAVAL